MWTGVTQQDAAQTEAPAPGHGSPRRKLDAGRGAPPRAPKQPAGLCGVEEHDSHPKEQQIALSHAGVAPGVPAAACPAQPEFVEVGGRRWDMATSTWPWGHGGRLPSWGAR